MNAPDDTVVDFTGIARGSAAWNALSLLNAARLAQDNMRRMKDLADTLHQQTNLGQDLARHAVAEMNGADCQAQAERCRQLFRQLCDA